MSTYFTMQGEITYEQQEDFDAALKVAEEWTDGKGRFTTEDDEVITEQQENIYPTERRIVIPWGLYRNFGRFLDELFKGGKGWAVWTSTDGMFEGGVYEDGKETTYDLEEWAKEHFFDEGESMPDAQEDFDEYVEVQSEIESEFHNEFGK